MLESFHNIMLGYVPKRISFRYSNFFHCVCVCVCECAHMCARAHVYSRTSEFATLGNQGVRKSEISVA